MIVLAESNFVLELALQQEQFEDAEEILRLAEDKRLQLFVPACSLLEPYQTLTRRGRERKELGRKLQGEIKLLERSALHDGIAGTSDHVAETLEVGTDLEWESLEKIIERLSQICTVPAMSVDVVKLGRAMQMTYELEPQDAIVFACIDTALERLHEGTKVFVNKNSRDFRKPLVENQLEKRGCRLITSFSSACQFIQNELRVHRFS